MLWFPELPYNGRHVLAALFVEKPSQCRLYLVSWPYRAMLHVLAVAGKSNRLELILSSYVSLLLADAAEHLSIIRKSLIPGV